MKPAPFAYHAPATVEEALARLVDYGGEAKVLAGGQSLIPTMNFRLAQPAALVDLNPITELAYIRPDPQGGLRLGAMTRHSHVEVSSLVAERAPLVYAAMPDIAHPQIRNRGTIGGSLAHADPAAELPALMVALEAQLRLLSNEGERWLGAADFFVDIFTTALEPTELLVEIAIPVLPVRSGWGFREVARRHGDYALVGAAAVVTLDEREACQTARLVFFSVGPGPVLARQAATLLEGEQPTAQAIEAAADVASTKDIEPSADIHASVAYRRHLARALAGQTLTQAVARARAKGT